MQCLQDYIKESKNKSFEELAFNELDGAVLSMLVLLDVAKCAPKVHRKGITFEEYITRYVTLHGTKYVGLLIPPALIRLLSRAKTGSRFKNLIIVDGFSKISDKEETQSTFLSVILPDKTRVVLFGSTDDTVVGWQEDFNLLCSSHVPCLDYAVKYVNDVCKKSEKLIFMGHSKGGFESLYSCAYCDEEIYQKIINAYSFDGPGYSIDIISDKRFIRALDKMVLVVPNGGIVGRLFYNPIEPNIVPSKYRGLIQHDILFCDIFQKQN